MNNTMFDTIRSGAGRALDWIDRDLARRGLLRMSDRALADKGFSRERLEAGVGAWPWRVEDDAAETLAAIRTARAHRVATPDVAGDPGTPARRHRAGPDGGRASAPFGSDERHGSTEERLAA